MHMKQAKLVLTAAMIILCTPIFDNVFPDSFILATLWISAKSFSL